MTGVTGSAGKSCGTACGRVSGAAAQHHMAAPCRDERAESNASGVAVVGVTIGIHTQRLARGPRNTAAEHNVSRGHQGQAIPIEVVGDSSRNRDVFVSRHGLQCGGSTQTAGRH